MKKILSAILYTAAAATIAGCAKEVSVGSNDANKRFFDAWIHVNHPTVTPTDLGVYVLEETKGNGTTVEKDGFAIVDCIITDLEGNIKDYTDKETAKQLGQYDTAYYYGPKIWTTTEGTIQAGVADALIGMKAGGMRKVAIPGWLLTYKVYDNAEDYLNPPKDELTTSTTYDNAIYEFNVRDYVKDINEYQIGQIDEYLKDNPQLGLTVKDSLQRGFYYKELEAPQTLDSLKSDTTVYINYTGRLLNGLVFDTTNERVAKDNGIYSSKKKYKPVPVKWASDYADIRLDGSTIIKGFALTLWQMQAAEKGVGIFFSDLGYSYSGSGKSIPGYAPLVFEIELVAKPEDK
jgi:FKBP-type peptidyl-prolyl cis-trans isomerase FklB